jgi:hypothetical protein
MIVCHCSGSNSLQTKAKVDRNATLTLSTSYCSLKDTAQYIDDCAYERKAKHLLCSLESRHYSHEYNTYYDEHNYTKTKAHTIHYGIITYAHDSTTEM